MLSSGLFLFVNQIPFAQHVESDSSIFSAQNKSGRQLSKTMGFFLSSYRIPSFKRLQLSSKAPCVPAKARRDPELVNEALHPSVSSLFGCVNVAQWLEKTPQPKKSTPQFSLKKKKKSLGQKQTGGSAQLLQLYPV